MKQVIIENPILNSPFKEPARHFLFSDEGITNEIMEAVRVSSYFIPIAKPKKKGKAAQLAFDTEWTKGHIEENATIKNLRFGLSPMVPFYLACWLKRGSPGRVRVLRERMESVR